jgi:hypothetical protein
MIFSLESKPTWLAQEIFPSRVTYLTGRWHFSLKSNVLGWQERFSLKSYVLGWQERFSLKSYVLGWQERFSLKSYVLGWQVTFFYSKVLYFAGR